MKLHTRSVGEDVDYLGSLLGSIFEARTSRDAFETVERVRHESIDYRSGERESRERVEEVLGGLDPSTENVVARAFTSYFELINLAEERQRIRSIRTASQEGTLEETLADAVAELKAAASASVSLRVPSWEAVLIDRMRWRSSARLMSSK